MISNSADLNFIDGDIHSRACGTKLLIKYQTVLVALIVSAIWSAIDNPNEICISLSDNGWVWKSHPTLYNGCNYLSILGLKLMKGAPGRQWIPIFISSQRKKMAYIYSKENNVSVYARSKGSETPKIFLGSCAPIQLAVMRLTARSREVSKPRDSGLNVSNRSKIWQASR